MARIRRNRSAHHHKIVLIDDDLDLATSTRTLLVRDGHEVLLATDPAAGIELVRTARPQLVLLDYLMPTMTGADVVRAVRKFDDMVQILLVTGYAEQQPGRRLLAELDIQGYHDKGDGPDRLLVLVDAALKHQRALARIDSQRRSLRHLVTVGPGMSQLQPARQLFEFALTSLMGLLASTGDALVATSNNGLFITEDVHAAVSVRAGTRRFAHTRSLRELPLMLIERVQEALKLQRPDAIGAGVVAVPLTTRDGARGCIVVEAKGLSPDAVEACEIYGRMVVQALENLSLYERATHDQLCRVWNRSFGMQRLSEFLKLAGRDSGPTSVILADVDHFKGVNDRWGHAGGDLVLVSIAQTLRAGGRQTDVVARYGGEEFLIVLPATTLADAEAHAERLREQVASLAVEFEGHKIALTASFGVACSSGEPWRPDLSAELVRRADEALYRAKRSGRNRVAAEADDCAA